MPSLFLIKVYAVTVDTLYTIFFLVLILLQFRYYTTKFLLFNWFYTISLRLQRYCNF